MRVQRHRHHFSTGGPQRAVHKEEMEVSMICSVVLRNYTYRNWRWFDRNVGTVTYLPNPNAYYEKLQNS
jgi:hypothetical protein